MLDKKHDQEMEFEGKEGEEEPEEWGKNARKNQLRWRISWSFDD